jgi:splicing factor 3A subunit 2
LETINLEKDPYIFKNHHGVFECRLCLTTHSSDSSYLSHTQARKHQTNLARREALERKERKVDPITGQPITTTAAPSVPIKKVVRIGRPGYKITKIRDPVSKQAGLLFHIKYPELGTGVTPRYRLMSTFEQKVEPADKSYQYLLVAAEPYEICAFKIEAKEIDQNPGRFWTFHDKDTNDYFLQFFYR